MMGNELYFGNDIKSLKLRWICLSSLPWNARFKFFLFLDVTKQNAIKSKYYAPAANIGSHRHLQSLPEERHSYKYSYKRVNFNALFMIPEGLTNDEDCVKRPGSSIDEFPEDLFTRKSLNLFIFGIF